MLLLALDTSSPAGSLAVLRDQKVVGVISAWTGETYSSRMFRHLEFLLRELSLGLEQFDLFAIAAGPGSFTGLRVGLAAAKGWAEAYRKPVAAISALEAVAAQSHSSARLLVPVLDARRGQIYFGFYRGSDSKKPALVLEGEECVMNPEEFLEALRARAGNSDCSIVSPTPQIISSIVSRIETLPPVEQVSTVLAPLIGMLGYQRAERGELVDAMTLDANYVRRSDAELHWKARGGS